VERASVEEASVERALLPAAFDLDVDLDLDFEVLPLI